MNLRFWTDFCIALATITGGLAIVALLLEGALFLFGVPLGWWWRAVAAVALVAAILAALWIAFDFRRDE